MRIMMEGRVVSVGALYALAILMVADCLISFWCLSRRPVRVHATKTVVVSPERLRFELEAPPGWSDLRIVLRRFSITDRDSEFATLARTDESQPLEMSDGGTHQAGFVRFLTETSFLGLVAARRWATQVTPTLHRMGEPIEEDVDIASTDDRGRIRSYLPGDRMGSVSWGASARTGSLHVRAPAHDLDEITLVVDIGTDLAFEDGVNLANPILARAFAVGQELLATGRTVRVITNRVTPVAIQHELDASLRNPRNPKLRGLEFAPPGEGNHTFLGGPLSTVVSEIAYDETALIKQLTTASIGPPVAAPIGPHIAVRPQATSVVRT